MEPLASAMNTSGRVTWRRRRRWRCTTSPPSRIASRGVRRWSRGAPRIDGVVRRGLRLVGGPHLPAEPDRLAGDPPLVQRGSPHRWDGAPRLALGQGPSGLREETFGFDQLPGREGAEGLVPERLGSAEGVHLVLVLVVAVRFAPDVADPGHLAAVRLRRRGVAVDVDVVGVAEIAAAFEPRIDLARGWFGRWVGPGTGAPVRHGPRLRGGATLAGSPVGAEGEVEDGEILVPPHEQASAGRVHVGATGDVDKIERREQVRRLHWAYRDAKIAEEVDEPDDSDGEGLGLCVLGAPWTGVVMHR